MGAQSMLILFSAPPRLYSNDVSYEFRQNSDFYYLTGIRQADSRLVLLPGDPEDREVLFLSESDPARALWTGEVLTHEEATSISGIAQVRSVSEFEAFIDSLLNKSLGQKEESEVYLLLNGPGLSGTLGRELQFANRIEARFKEARIRNAAPLIHALRLVKSDYELDQLRSAVDITTEALNRAISLVEPGMWEYQVEAEIEYIFKKHNSLDWAFPSIVASGRNSTILHHHANQRQLKAGDLLLMDVGADFNYYAADVTRTVPVNGSFTPAQADIYQIVLDAQKAGISRVKPGSSMAEIQAAAVKVLKAGLLRLGLITDASENQYRVFFPHGVSHWMGIDVHDPGSREERLRPGMVLTVEPGIYVREDALERLSRAGHGAETINRIRPAVEKYLNIGVRIEDDLVVTQEGYELLSGGVPGEMEEIVERVGSSSKSQVSSSK